LAIILKLKIDGHTGICANVNISFWIPHVQKYAGLQISVNFEW